MKVEKIAILGGGNGGITAAADLTEKGFLVNILSRKNSVKTCNLLNKKMK